MHSKYLKCDECSAVIDRRAIDDFGGDYARLRLDGQQSPAHGTFAPGEWPELLKYAASLGWQIHENLHLCPKHK